MKIAVFGATGGTGSQLVRQAVDAGHDVTAVVRDPGRLAADLPPLRVVTAELTDAAAAGAAVAGQDVVVSAIGPRDRGPTTVCADSATTIVAAMEQHGVRRLLVISNSGMHVDDHDGLFTRGVVKPMLARMLAHGFADMRRMEEIVAAADLDWTVVRPPMLTDGRRTGRWRTAVGHNLPRATRISRADLAGALLRYAADEGTVRAAVAVAL
ncbi:NAD(P)-dependent oxidoreductase [Actinoplanes sp. NPDC000266]